MRKSKILSIFWKILRTPTRKILTIASSLPSGAHSQKHSLLKMLSAPLPVFRAFLRLSRKKGSQNPFTTSGRSSKPTIDPLIFQWRDVFVMDPTIGDAKIPDWETVCERMRTAAELLRREAAIHGEISRVCVVTGNYNIAGRIARIRARFEFDAAGIPVMLDEREVREQAKHLTAFLN